MNVENKVPAIRFEGFSGEWLEKVLDDEVELFSGLTYSPSDVVKENGTFVLRSSNVKNGAIVQADNVYVNTEIVNSENVRVGDIVIVVRNGSRSLIGKHAAVKKEMNDTVIGAFMTGMHTKQSNFINALLDTKQFNKEIEKNLGATINQITNGAVREMKFYFSIPEEQTQIGNYFQLLDTLIVQHKKKHEKLLKLKKSLLEKMFPKQDKTEPEIRLKGFSGKWELCELGKHSIIKGRLGWKSLKQNEYLEDGPSMIAGRHITNGVINWDIVDHIPEWRYLESPEIMLKNDDVIFSKDGSLGNPALIKNLQGYATINSTMMLVRPNERLVSDFFFQVLKTKRFDDLIKLKVSGSSIPHLFQADMNQFEFDYPAPEEQAKIGKLFKQLDTLISQHQAQLKKLSNIKQACLEKMFV